MKKEIGFSGINLTPYTDISPDGQLTYSHGLEMHNGSLRPSLLAGKKYTLADNDGKLLETIHQTSAYSHLLFLSGDDIMWCDNDNSSPLAPELVGTHSGIYNIGCVGNTLTVLTESGLEYYLWKDGAYKYLGSRMPEIKIRFSLVGITSSNELTENYDSLLCYCPKDGSEFYDTLPDELGNTTKEAVTSFSLGAITRFIEDQKKEGNVCCPFFIRYCYRLFDGTSYTKFSSPVLMIPNSVAPILSGSFIHQENIDNKYWKIKLWPVFLGEPSSKIYFKVDEIPDDLTDWSDIISSVEVAVTQQAYPFRQDVSVYQTYMEGETMDLGYRIGATANDDGTYNDSDFQKVDYTAVSQWNMTTIKEAYRMKIERKSTDDFETELLGLSQFYNICEMNLEEIQESSGWEKLKITSDALPNLTTRESADDSYDYKSHDNIIAQNSFVYNQRLHLFNVSRSLFKGFALPYMNQYCYNLAKQTRVYTFIHAGDGTVRVVKSDSVVMNMAMGHFLYYPDVNAYQMLIAITAGSKLYKFKLSPHPFLNGAYALAWEGLDFSTVAVTSDPWQVTTPVLELNKLYTSDIGNPFVFPPKGIYTIGTGEILGISNIATPLSQGQFGQFPLLLFCSDGNYAMNVDSEGSYTTVSPIQRDVCITPSTITQTDREVVFTSERGIMITDGTTLRCLSEQMDGYSESLPGDSSEVLDVPNTSLNALLGASLVAYDYANQRLLFFLYSEHTYVLSLKSNTWSTANFGRAVQILNVFPYSYVQFEDGDIYCLHRPDTSDIEIIGCHFANSDTLDGKFASTPSSDYVRIIDGEYADAVYDTASGNSYDGGSASSIYEGETDLQDNTIYNGVLFTRPLKLDDYQLKRINQFHLQGVYSRPQRIYLYGSQDGQKWLFLGSTSSPRARMVGKPFKYFRFAVVTSLTESENLSGLRLDYDILKERRYR